MLVIGTMPPVSYSLDFPSDGMLELLKGFHNCRIELPARSLTIGVPRRRLGARYANFAAAGIALPGS